MEPRGAANEQREFHCIYCNGKILIPRDLPPTTAPCPHCGKSITSPQLEAFGPLAGGLPPVPTLSPTPEPVAPPQQPAAAVATPVPVHEPLPPVGLPDAPLPASRPVVPVAVATPVTPAASGNGASAAVVPPVEVAPPADPDLEALLAGRKPSTGGGIGAAKRSSLVMPMLVLLMLILLAGGVWIFLSKQLGKGGGGAIKAPPNQRVEAQVKEDKYLTEGWQEEARQTLQAFLAADTLAGKAAYALRGSELTKQMEAFYGSGRIDDSGTPIQAFSAYDLPEPDKKRGIFMMLYDQPKQFEMRDFFGPLAKIEVQMGLEEPDMLLTVLGRRENFESPPIRVHALFKRTPEGLRLDWETFVQTKYRTLRTFLDNPQAGESKVFRVLIREDVPEKGRAVPGTLTYQLLDPAHAEDSARVNIPVDSELGRTLSVLNWRGEKDARMTIRTATVEVEWTRDATPLLSLKRFICWEFLGLGGEVGQPPATPR